MTEWHHPQTVTSQIGDTAVPDCRPAPSTSVDDVDLERVRTLADLGSYQLVLGKMAEFRLDPGYRRPETAILTPHMFRTWVAGGARVSVPLSGNGVADYFEYRRGGFEGHPAEVYRFDGVCTFADVLRLIESGEDNGNVPAVFRTPRNSRDAVERVAYDVLAGLTTAKEAGVAHGRFTPESIAISRTGRAGLWDFGGTGDVDLDAIEAARILRRAFRRGAVFRRLGHVSGFRDLHRALRPRSRRSVVAAIACPLLIWAVSAHGVARMTPERAMAKGEYDQAVEMYSDLVAHQPHDREAKRNLGLALCGKGDTDRALRSLEVPVDAPVSVEAPKSMGLLERRALAYCLADVGLSRRAIQELMSLVDSGDRSPSTLRNLAYVNGRVRQDEASRALNARLHDMSDELEPAERHRLRYVLAVYEAKRLPDRHALLEVAASEAAASVAAGASPEEFSTLGVYAGRRSAANPRQRVDRLVNPVREALRGD